MRDKDAKALGGNAEYTTSKDARVPLGRLLILTQRGHCMFQAGTVEALDKEALDKKIQGLEASGTPIVDRPWVPPPPSSDKESSRVWPPREAIPYPMPPP